MIKIEIALGLILIPTVLMSHGLLPYTGDRETTSHNGSWNFIADPYENDFLNFNAQVFEQKDQESIAALFLNIDTGILDNKLGEYVDILAFNPYPRWDGGELTTATDAKMGYSLQ